MTRTDTLTALIQDALVEYCLDVVNDDQIALEKRTKAFEILNSAGTSGLATYEAINYAKDVVTEETTQADVKNNLIGVYWENVYVQPS